MTDMKIVMRKGASETNNKRSNKYLNAGFCCFSNLKKLYIIYLDSLRHLLYHHYRNHLLFAYLLHASLDEITKKKKEKKTCRGMIRVILFNVIHPYDQLREITLLLKGTLMQI